MKLLFQSSKGQRIYRTNNNLIILFQDNMRALSTSQLNGGIIEINSCFNNYLDYWVESITELPGGNIASYYRLKSQELGLDPQKTSGLMTTASLDKATIIEKEFRDINLFALITAGVKVNAVRAGEPASFYEEKYNTFSSIGGTINIFLVIEAELQPETLIRAAVTAAEAKAAALQEMNISSCFSSNNATGTGTDGLLIACYPKHNISFSDAGTHSKLGELIASTIITGIKQSLEKE